MRLVVIITQRRNWHAYLVSSVVDVHVDAGETLMDCGCFKMTWCDMSSFLYGLVSSHLPNIISMLSGQERCVRANLIYPNDEGMVHYWGVTRDRIPVNQIPQVAKVTLDQHSFDYIKWICYNIMYQGMYVESRKMVQMKLFVGQEERCRCKEQICGHRMGRWGWIRRLGLKYIHYHV